MPFFMDDDDDDDSTVEEEEEEEEEEDDESETIARIEQSFREERRNIRACVDLQELYTLRRDYHKLLSNKQLLAAARIRGNDILELIDDRVTDLKAKSRS